MALSHHWLAASLVLVGVAASAQKGSIDLERLRGDRIHVTGQGEEIPGISMRAVGVPKHWVGDDSTWSVREYDDAGWNLLFKTEDSVVAGATVHWVRYQLYPNADLKGVPLVLDIGTGASAEVFLNGQRILRADQPSVAADRTDLPMADSLPTVSVPVSFQCDGQREIVAVRLEVAAGTPLDRAGLDVVLREGGSAYAAQRFTMHYGVFIGVNLIILVLSVILWSQDRRERSWLLLALLSLIQGIDSVTDVAGDPGLLGFSEPITRCLDALSTLLMPWPLYLLIMVLGTLRGDLSPKSVRRYSWALVFVTVVLAAIGFGQFMGADWFTGLFTDKSGVDTSSGFSIADPEPWLVVLLVIAVLLLIPFGLVLLWFVVDVLRLGLRLVRSKGYERWVGGGALASSLAGWVLSALAGRDGPGSDWLNEAGMYCDHVAVPVAVAIYLALRSAHHSKAVARQRDDLDREVHERTAELREEKKRSDDLLLNILPAEVAEELKRTGMAEARHFDQATVLFTDFKGFTTMSEQVPPTVLLAELNTCFRAFDGIIARHGIEKIKTIGDAYMCASGLPDPTTSTPVAVVHAALEMQAFMRQRKAEREVSGELGFIMRAGIHTGPVVAGIVGVKKFQYDIWGDTVNTASRMESSGEVGHVNISESTYDLVKSEAGLTFTPRGKVQAKGKGEMEMYFVTLNGPDRRP